MPKTRGGYASAPQSSQRATPVRAPLDAPPHLPDSTPQSKYHTRRAAATPVAPTQIPPRSPPTKNAKTLEPGESSRAPRDSQSQPPSTRRPRASLPIECNSDCQSREFYVEAYFDYSILRQQLELRDSYRLLERQIADAFHIPYAPADPTVFRRWAPLSEWDMVRILSRRTSSQRIIMRRELPLGMLLVDVVLRANLFPLQHRVQRRGAILEALFRISKGYYFGPHHLIMAALLHFEEKHSPELPEPREVPPALSTSTPSEPVPKATSSDAPPAVPPTSEPPITIHGAEYRALLAFFQTLTTT
ncbi:hypothetical protein CK203_104563 [Vitis vinifera]|uniref:Uncharacterized protein n=1 Tax=Vitis vinifera TaxID=29760 RepID=A0A438FGL6_VITVI|nr:hypothetical protein CK203_104563 [Vitis vinifera]